MSKKNLKRSTKITLVATLGLVAFVSSLPTATAFMSGFSWAQNQLKTITLNDSMQTAVTQDVLGSMQLAETIVAAKQRQISTEDMLIKKANLVDLYTDFMASSANPRSANCVAVNSREKESRISKRVLGFVTSDIINNMNNSGNATTLQMASELRDIKNSVACTLEMSKQGYCTPTLTDGEYYDVDMGLVLSNQNLSEGQFIAAKAGILSVANPVGDSLAISECGTDKACSNVLSTQNNKLAVNSLVVNSLLTQVYNRLATGVPQ